MPSRWRGRSGATRSSSAVVQSTTSCICALSWPSEPPIGDPVTAAGGDRAGGDHPQVVLHPALDDPVDGLAVGPVALVPVQAARQPAVGALHRARRVVAGDVKRRALVEHQRDVRAQRRLHGHRGLGTHEPLAAVQVGAKADPLLLDGQDRAVGVTARPHGLPAPALDLVGDAAVAHREHLKAARVGDDRAVPAHELVQAAHLGHQLVARAPGRDGTCCPAPSRSRAPRRRAARAS